MSTRTGLARVLNDLSAIYWTPVDRGRYKFDDELDVVYYLSTQSWGSLARRMSIKCEAAGFTRPAKEFTKRSGRKPSRRTPASKPLITTFEMRAAMSDRKSLVCTLWVTSSLALLASVLVALNRASEFVAVSSRPDCVRRDLDPPPDQSTTCVSAAMATDSVLQVNALVSENEEPDRADPLGEPRVPFLIPCSFRKVTDRQVTVPRARYSPSTPYSVDRRLMGP